MMTLYMACVALGGVLMGASILLGGDDGDADLDADVDVDADFDLDVDGDADLDVGHGGGLDFSVLPFGSLRFWTFLTEAFGLTGALLTLAGVPSGLTIGASVLIGGGVGWGAFTFFRYLAREEVSGSTQLTDMSQSEGKVLVRIPVGGTGKIAIDQLSGRVEMMARSGDGEEIPHGATVLVVGVQEGVAQVTALSPSKREATDEARQAVAAAQKQSERSL